MSSAPDGLDDVPWWDAKALRLVESLERSIVRLHLDSQGEFVAVINAIEFQLESPDPVRGVVESLIEALRTLSRARIEQRHQARIDQRLQEITDRLTSRRSTR